MSRTSSTSSSVFSDVSPESLSLDMGPFETVHRWKKMPDCDEFVGSRRSKASVVAYKDAIYIFGGDNGKNMLNDFLRFDVKEKSWGRAFSTGSPPIPRYHHSAQVFGDSMFVFGGYTGDIGSNANLTNKNDLFRYKFSTGQWVEWKYTGKTPDPRSAHGSVVYDGKLWIFAGYDGNQRLNDMWNINLIGESNLRTWDEITQTGEIPPSCCNFPAVVARDSIFMFSGQSGAKMDNSLYQFTFIDKCWTRISIDHILRSSIYSQPTRRYGHTMVAFDSCLYVFGGAADNTLPNDLFCYDLDQKYWSIISPSADSQIPAGRLFHIAACIGSAMYIYGGTVDNNVRSGEIYRFQFSNHPKCSLSEDFGRLLDSKNFCDIDFIVGNDDDETHIFAHIALVAARSKWLRTKIRQAIEEQIKQDEKNHLANGTEKEKETKMRFSDKPLEVRLRDASPEAFNLLLFFIYTDRVDLFKLSLNPTNQKCVLLMMDLYRLSVMCHMKWLEQLCIQYLETTINTTNALEALKYASLSNLIFIKEFCLKFIVKEINYTQIVMSKEFETLDNLSLVTIVRRKQQPSSGISTLSLSTTFPEVKEMQVTSLEQDLEYFLNGSGRDFCDLTLQLDNKCISVHKAILAARCKYFEAMFRFNETNQDDNVVKIQIGEMIPSRQSLDSLLRYIYYGEIRMPPEDSLYLFSAPYYFGFTNNRLQAFCKQNLEMNVTFQNVINILEAANRIHANDMKKYALNLIVNNFPKVAKLPKMKSLNRELLLEILETLADNMTPESKNARDIPSISRINED